MVETDNSVLFQLLGMFKWSLGCGSIRKNKFSKGHPNAILKKKTLKTKIKQKEWTRDGREVKKQ